MDSKENALMVEHLTNLKRRGVPDTDPRVKAIKRILDAQRITGPKAGRDYPAQLTFKPRRKQNG